MENRYFFQIEPKSLVKLQGHANYFYICNVNCLFLPVYVIVINFGYFVSLETNDKIGHGKIK
jgi:hypothetical protein